MTTTASAGLFQAILAEPLADDLRLIYADALEDEGDTERAEFVRVQVSMPRELRRQRELLDAHGSVWFLDFLRAIGQTHARVERHAWHYRSVNQRLGWCLFRRGLVEEVSLTLDDFLTHARAIFRAAPVLRVTLADGTADLDCIAHGRRVAGLPPLDLDRTPGPGQATY